MKVCLTGPDLQEADGARRVMGTSARAARGGAPKAAEDLAAVDESVCAAWNAAKDAGVKFGSDKAMTVALLKRFMSGRQSLSNEITGKRDKLVKAAVAYMRKHEGKPPERK